MTYWIGLVWCHEHQCLEHTGPPDIPPEPPAPPREEQVECPVCGKKVWPRGLAVHMRKKHPAEPGPGVT